MQGCDELRGARIFGLVRQIQYKWSFKQTPSCEENVLRLEKQMHGTR